MQPSEPAPRAHRPSIATRTPKGRRTRVPGVLVSIVVSLMSLPPVAARAEPPLGADADEVLDVADAEHVALGIELASAVVAEARHVGDVDPGTLEGPLACRRDEGDDAHAADA